MARDEARPPAVDAAPKGRRTALAFDFGGTKLAVGLIDVARKDWVSVRRTPTPTDAPTSLEMICALADEMRADDRRAYGESLVEGVGVSFGGHVDAPTGVVRRSVQVPGWDDTPLAAILADRYAAPTEISNDGTAGAIGEWMFGAGRGAANVVYVTVSTGVGGGLIVDGRPYEGTAGFAAEFGHVQVEDHGDLCKCGLTGCLETLASGPALARRATRALERGTASALSGVPRSLTGLDVSMAAAAGDALAIEILHDAGRAVARVVSMIVITLDPRVVLLGGGVAHAPAPFWESFRSSIRAPARSDRWLRLGPAEFIDDAPLYGARGLALRLAGASVER